MAEHIDLKALSDRELCILAAQRLFGWQEAAVSEDGLHTVGVNEEGHRHTFAFQALERVFPFATTGDGMLLVVEAMRGRGWLYEVGHHLDGTRHYAKFLMPTTDPIHEDWAAEEHAIAPTAPRAVCIAALRAVGEGEGR